jgi:DNA polymerase III subunit epsilon
MCSFVVIDVETANASLDSICQIGVASFDAGGVADEWVRLVDPEDFFDEWNIDIHGITEDDVEGAPTFDEVLDELESLLHDQVVVSHTSFDRVALERAAEKYGLGFPACTWLDSARVVRRAWPERYARAGYGLSNVAADLAIEYTPHDALEDARAAGEVLLHAIRATGLTVDEWIARVRRPIFQTSPWNPVHDPNPEGPLYGEVACFTGALQVPRREAAAHAAAAGCAIGNGVTKATTLLVVGDQDIRKLSGHEMSSKHRKAMDLISRGQLIRVLSEADFLRVVSPIPAPTLTTEPAPRPTQRRRVLPNRPRVEREPKHFTDLVGPIKEAKRSGEFSRAEELLLRAIEWTEEEEAEDRLGVAPWYYEHLAIVYRRQRRFADEVAVLERYGRQRKGPGVSKDKLAQRLAQARRLESNEE